GLCLVIVYHAFEAAYAVSKEIEDETGEASPKGFAPTAVPPIYPFLYRTRLYAVASLLLGLCGYCAYHVWHLSTESTAKTEHTILNFDQPTHPKDMPLLFPLYTGERPALNLGLSNIGDYDAHDVRQDFYIIALPGSE